MARGAGTAALQAPERRGREAKPSPVEPGKPATPRQVAMSWAQRLKRVFSIEIDTRQHQWQPPDHRRHRGADFMVLRLLCRAAVGHVRRLDILEAVRTVWIQVADPGVAGGEGRGGLC